MLDKDCIMYLTKVCLKIKKENINDKNKIA